MLQFVAMKKIGLLKTIRNAFIFAHTIKNMYNVSEID